MDETGGRADKEKEKEKAGEQEQEKEKRGQGIHAGAARGRTEAMFGRRLLRVWGPVRWRPAGLQAARSAPPRHSYSWRGTQGGQGFAAAAAAAAPGRKKGKRGRTAGALASRGLEVDADERASALEMALGEIEKAHGSGAVMKLGDADDIAPLVVPISTGSLGLDQALGVGGLPRGRVVEIFGPESSGKTTLALHVVAEAQRLGGKCTFVDAEHALDPAYARAIGVDVDDLYISQPDSGEQALEIADALTRSGAMDVVVIDSVAALVPRAELEGEMGDAHMALQARLMSQALRKMTATLSRSNTLLIFINQIRSKIGVLFGSPEVTAGGNALKFYASVRMDIRRVGQITDGDETVGNRTRVKIVKNKVAPPFRETEFDMMYGQGICQHGEMIDVGLHLGVLRRSGAWYSFEGVPEDMAGELEELEEVLPLAGDLEPWEGAGGATNFAQGKMNARTFLQKNPSCSESLKGAILVAIDVRRRRRVRKQRLAAMGIADEDGDGSRDAGEDDGPSVEIDGGREENNAA